jgi:mitogen-activated protein kinase 1/3
MRKLSEVKSNVYTVKIYDIIVPDEFDASTDDPLDHIFIVMEYIESNLLYTLLNASELQFSGEHMLIIMYNALCSLNFLHTANIMHRDIKPANVLMDENCGVIYCDFGLARTLIKPNYPDMDAHVEECFNLLVDQNGGNVLY